MFSLKYNFKNIALKCSAAESLRTLDIISYFYEIVDKRFRTSVSNDSVISVLCGVTLRINHCLALAMY